MDLFWDYYNSVLHIVHKEAFNEDMQSGSSKYYSGFLHISILAMGYRFADLEREDMKKITLGNRECTLHREAKYMLDMELERPGGIPSVQAFLLLGDLECGVGRDNTGWMYAGKFERTHMEKNFAEFPQEWLIDCVSISDCTLIAKMMACQRRKFKFVI